MVTLLLGKRLRLCVAYTGTPLSMQLSVYTYFDIDMLGVSSTERHAAKKHNITKC